MSRFIACADLHIRSNRPQFRKDEYFKTVCTKFRQIISLSNKHCAHIIVAGDFFDSVKVGHKVVNTILKIMENLSGKQRVFVVAGQHDMSYHTQDLTGSPLQTLIHAGKIELLTHERPSVVVEDGKEDWLYGCSFGELIETNPAHKDPILVIHHAVTEYEPPWFLSDAMSSKEMLKKYSKYSLIISGDFHEPFSVRKKGRVLVNCGPMVRQSIDQTELKPRVWYIDTVGKKCKPIFLNIEPAESVFALEDIKKKEESDFSKELSDLVDTLKSESEKPDYKETVKLIMEEGKVSEGTRDKVNSILGEMIDE